MFGLSMKGPTHSFVHADDCKIVKADPGVEIMWSEIESGHWQAECRCGKETFMRRPPTVVLGLTRMTRLPSATRRNASTGARPIPLSFERS